MALALWPVGPILCFVALVGWRAEVVAAFVGTDLGQPRSDGRNPALVVVATVP